MPDDESVDEPAGDPAGAPTTNSAEAPTTNSADESSGGETPRSRRTWLIVAVSLLAAGSIAALAVFTATRPGDEQARPSASPGASSDSSASGSPTPSGSTNPSTDPSASPSSSTDAPPATAAPPTVDPDNGNVDQGSASPAPIDEVAPVTEGVTVALTSFESVQGEATAPGDIAAPSVRFTVTVVNSTSAEVDLSSAVVNVYYSAEQTPASPLPGPGGTTLPATVGAGESASAVMVFAIPASDRGDITITFDYSAATQVVVFTGAGPAA